MEEPAPVPAPGEELIRVTAVGICGSDLLWLATQGIGDARLDAPLVLGHEFAGVVDSGEYKGRRVAVDPAVSCGRCRFCLAGHPNLCLSVRFAGHGHVDGALRDYVSWPASCLYPLPEGISDAEGAMLEPLGVAIHALDLGRVRIGASVGVFGCGPIGLLVVQLARMAGADRIIATDVLPHRLELAARMGATHALLAGGDEERAVIGEATDGLGVDTAFEMSGEDAAVADAVDAVRPGGVVVLAGIPEDDRTGFRASTARRKGLTMMLVRRMKHTYPRAMRMAAQGLVDLNTVISHRFPLTEYETAFSLALERKGAKVIVEP